MASSRVFAGLVIVTTLAAAPLSADQGRRRADSERGRERATEQADRGRRRAVPRSPGVERQVDRQNEQRQQQIQRQEQAQRQQQILRQNDARQYQAQRQYDNRQYPAPRQYDNRQYQAQRQSDDRQYPAPRQYDNRRYQAQRQYDARGQYEAQRRYESDRRYDSRRDYGRPSYSSRGYGRAVPRIIRPTVVTVIPYRRYSYRPRLSIGVYYGAGGVYPYGYTPRGYYDPIPGRLYGGLRITGAPREAHVFADGYYVGIVDDFDGIFQHLNLEAGPHRIEVEVPGYESIAFDVMVQPGRTTTFRADYY
jgi:hypothetical protein